MVGSPSPPSSLQGRSRQTHQFPSHQRSATADDNVTTVTRVMKSEDWPEFPCSPIVPDPCSHAGRAGCRTAGKAPPRERGRPARILSLWPPLSFPRCCRQPYCRREQQRPDRRRAMAPFPVDPSGGDGRGCARLGAGGTPALPASHHPMTSSHPGHKIAEAFWCRLSLKEVHLSSCLFVSIRGSSSLAIGRLSSNDPHGRAGARLAGNREFPQRCTSAF